MRVRKLPIELEAEGMEDGYMCYEIGGRFIGYYPKNRSLPRVVRKPAIMTLEGPIEVSDQHYIITGVLGEHYPVRADVFIQTYEIIQPKYNKDKYADDIMSDKVEEFANAMERALLNKGGWEGIPYDDLFKRMRYRIDELEAAIEFKVLLPEDILANAADIANFVLMIYDNARKEYEKRNL